MARYLDETGVAFLWSKVKQLIENGVELDISQIQEVLKELDSKSSSLDDNITDLRTTVQTIIGPSGTNKIDTISDLLNFVDGIEGTEKLSTLLASVQTSSSQAVNTEKEAREAADDSIIDMIFGIHGQFTCSCNPATIEKGVPTNVNVNTGVTFNGKSLIHSVTVDGEPKANPYSVNDTKSFSVVFTINNADPKIATTVTKTATVNAYYPKYIGGSVNTELTDADVISLTKQSINGSAAGTYNVTSSDNQYIWFCVPSTMNITKVTLGGFAVPMQAVTTVAVTGKGNYKCYRTTNPLSAGTRSFVVS